MRRSFLLKSSLAASIIFCLGIGFWASARVNAPSHPPLPEELQRPYPIRVKGLSVSRLAGDKLLFKLRIGEFKVSPRKYFVFNIRPFNEASLTNVRQETHLFPNSATTTENFGVLFSDLDISASVGGILPNQKGVGLLTRGVIKGLIWEIFKDDRLCLRVKAKKAYVHFKKKKSKLKDVSIEHILSRKVIISRSAIWDEKEKLIKIPGAYRAATPKGTASGKGIKLDLDFVVSPLS